jgi:hypothetical protein
LTLAHLSVGIKLFCGGCIHSHHWGGQHRPHHLGSRRFFVLDQLAELPQDWDQGASREPTADSSHKPPQHDDFSLATSGWVLPARAPLHKHYFSVK